MKIFLKPKPSERYFSLTRKEAAHYAMQVAREFGENDQPDWQLFAEWTRAHEQRNRTKQLTLA